MLNQILAHKIKKISSILSTSLLIVLSLVNFNSNIQAEAYQIADSFQYPLNSTWKTSYNFKVDNPSRGGYHTGEDVSPATEEYVYATANGKVVHSRVRGGYGHVVLIEHELPDGSNVVSVYGHLKSTDTIAVDTQVTKGQQIGQLEADSNLNGGWGLHLHFGIRSGEFYDGVDSDGKWRYRGYAPEGIIDNWFKPSTFINQRLTSTPGCYNPLINLTFSTGVTNCSSANLFSISNVTVTNGATLNISSQQRIEINSNFSADLGSQVTLEIK